MSKISNNSQAKLLRKPRFLLRNEYSADLNEHLVCLPDSP